MATSTTLHCTALTYTPLYRTTQPSTPLHCTALYYLPTLRAICNVLSFGAKTNFKAEAVLGMLLTTFKSLGEMFLKGPRKSSAQKMPCDTKPFFAGPVRCCDTRASTKFIVMNCCYVVNVQSPDKLAP